MRRITALLVLFAFLPCLIRGEAPTCGEGDYILPDPEGELRL